MLKKIISVVYLITLVIIVFSVPVSAILLVCAACGTGMPWLGACVPLIIALAVSPFHILAKIILDEGNK